MTKATKKIISNNEQALLNELSQLIEQSQQQVVMQANSALTMLFWFIGKRINQTILTLLRLPAIFSNYQLVSTFLSIGLNLITIVLVAIACHTVLGAVPTPKPTSKPTLKPT